jgi:hypothetical protein
VAFVSLAEGIDATTPGGKLQIQSGSDRRVRAGAHSRTGARRSGAGQGTREAARSAEEPAGSEQRSWRFCTSGGSHLGCVEVDRREMDRD